jgi:hypothetical protein
MKYIKVILTLVIVFTGISCGNNSDDFPIFTSEDTALKDGSEYIVVLGDIQEYTDNKYYYPYFEGSQEKYYDDISVERHAEKESYAGVCDDLSLNVTLIFYVQNVADFLHEKRNNQLAGCTVTLRLSGLSTDGKINEYFFPCPEKIKTNKEIKKHTKIALKIIKKDFFSFVSI